MPKAALKEDSAQEPGAGPRVGRALGICTEGYRFFLPVAAAAVLSAVLGWPVAAAVLGASAVWMIWFFRDPNRRPPEDPAAIVSPADGRIIEIRRVPYPRLLEGEATRVSVFMSVFNVHVNRIPFGGTVRAVHHNPGRFLAAWEEKASLANEQTAVVLDTPGNGPILFVQIAGLVARRIICRLAPGDQVERAERFGLIRFGSRCDVYLPDRAEVAVKIGEKVRAGESTLGRFQ